MANPSLLLFGPQTTLPSTEQFAQLRDFLLHEPLLSKFREELQDLPNFWQLLIDSDASLEGVAGLDKIQAITQWLDSGDHPAPGDVSNVLRTPLTVIFHIIQYFQYLATLPATSSGSKHYDLLKSCKDGGVQGFCTGFLSGAAIASSKDEEEVNIQAGIALRLAVCIGAYVDFDGLYADKRVCLTVRWKSEERKEQFLKIMASYPEAYISVIFDHSTATVTIPQSRKSPYSESLAQNEIFNKKIEVEGRFHSPALHEILEKVTDLCKNLSCIQLPSAESLMVHVRTNSDGKTISEGSLSEIAAASLLTDIADWQSTLSESIKEIAADTQIAVFGFSDVIPTSISRSSNFKILRISNLPASNTTEAEHEYPENAIAIVGMGCKYAGADSLDEFWDIIKEGESQCEELPKDRWSLTGLRRGKEGSRFWGNFVRDPDAFDHAFFKKSPREAASMDPQQRLLLQTAYHAVESSGYFGETSRPEDIGCYIGVATTDYHDNIASHQPTAFSALGELRAFLCGRISYHFGWTGPSITYDTACSASMIAIDAACRAISTGQCSRALAGGVSLNTNPNLWENLRAANFLSPTGQTKPFDSKGDGYSRGEGCGLVFLKKLSDAVKDGDFVMGVIAASGVNQCMNESYITVPYGPSQVQLFDKVVMDSGIKPSDISFIENHGTGTQAGDPVEISSMRKVFGGAERKDTVHLGSVKGNIGHCEASSGVASLIKTVLMLQDKTIPPLASHESLNPKIPSLEPDKMAIPMTLKPWDNKFRAAFVSNYGAAGSNGALIVGQAADASHELCQDTALPKVPIFISAQSEKSLAAYSKVLQALIAALPSSALSASELTNLAYNLSRKQNRSLKYSLVGTSASLSDLSGQLDAFQPALTPSPKPVVLAFGGQTNNHVGLSKTVYTSSTLFRHHLNRCNDAMRDTGLKEIIPAIFQTDPVSDIVNLHCQFFAIQYACAKSWIDAGLRPAAIVGHSFGQLTAMCISGCLSLADAIKLVAGRATLMQEYWGEEPGSMISLEADINTTSHIISAASDSGFKLEIACYNGPKSHVVVGTAKAIDSVEQIIADEKVETKAIKYTRLSVTHGFHSQFTEPLLPGLTKLAAELQFSKSTIPLETCSNNSAWEEITPARIAEHTRTAVYFQEAVERIASRLGVCTWLEAGSNSSVTGMVRRALGSSSNSGHTFQAIKLSGDESALSGLADSTTNLWKFGHQVQFWPFHHSQSSQYESINLPPYQFEKNRHWLTWKDNVEAPQTAPAVESNTAPEKYELLKLNTQDQNKAQFTVDSRSEEFKVFVEGHAVLDQPLCPADLYVELVSKAALQLVAEQDSSYIPSVSKLSIVAPLGIDPNQIITLSLVQGVTEKSWNFKFTSAARINPGKITNHSSGQIHLTHPDDAVLASEFQRYEKLISYERAMSFLVESDADGMHGPLVYKSFSRVVNYAKYYQGIKNISSKLDEVAAEIIMPQQENAAFQNSLMDPVAVDNFVQVAGIKVNCLNPCPPNQVYICGHIERIQASKEFMDRDLESRSWTVVAHCTSMGEKDYYNDIYVFNENKKLAMLILGVRFTRVPIVSLAKALSAASSANAANTQSSSITSAESDRLTQDTQEPKATQAPNVPSKASTVSTAKTPDTGRLDQICSTLKDLLNKVADVPLNTIKDTSKFEELGIDSLMSTEVLSEVNETFGAKMSAEKFQDLQDVSSLGSYLAESLGSSSSTSSSNLSGSSTPSLVAESKASSASSLTEEPQASDSSSVANLAKLISEQLEIPIAMTSDVCLGDYGLDSLMGVQISNDIEEALGVSLDASEMSPEMTFGELVQKVLPDSKRYSQNQAVSDNEVGRKSALNSPRPIFKDVPSSAKRAPGDRMKTVLFKQAGETPLFADIYQPDSSQVNDSPRPVALMIHGGGHTMLSRKDVRSRQTELLLTNGFLPVSIDYRLCPEVDIINGPMTDVCDALQWARTELPELDLGLPGLKVDGDKVVVVGWSTGGTLSMTLGFNAIKRGVKPPDAILAFYCPTNYEDECWKKPNYPEKTEGKCPDGYDLLEGVQESPITGYNVDPRKGATGGWMSLEDPRSRIVLHMNWKGQALPILLNGLPSKSSLLASSPTDTNPSKQYLSLPQPSQEQIISISPCSQIKRRNYNVPTYLIHGTHDDLIPYQQMQGTYDALREKGIPSGLGMLEGAVHLFDLYSGRKENEWRIVREGYEFLFEQLWG